MLMDIPTDVLIKIITLACEDITAVASINATSSALRAIIAQLTPKLRSDMKLVQQGSLVNAIHYANRESVIETITRRHLTHCGDNSDGTRKRCHYHKLRRKGCGHLGYSEVEDQNNCIPSALLISSIHKFSDYIIDLLLNVVSPNEAAFACSIITNAVDRELTQHEQTLRDRRLRECIARMQPNDAIKFAAMINDPELFDSTMAATTSVNVNDIVLAAITSSNNYVLDKYHDKADLSLERKIEFAVKSNALNSFKYFMDIAERSGEFTPGEITALYQESFITAMFNSRYGMTVYLASRVGNPSWNSALYGYVQYCESKTMKMLKFIDEHVTSDTARVKGAMALSTQKDCYDMTAYMLSRVNFENCIRDMYPGYMAAHPGAKPLHETKEKFTDILRNETVTAIVSNVFNEEVPQFTLEQIIAIAKLRDTRNSHVEEFETDGFHHTLVVFGDNASSDNASSDNADDISVGPYVDFKTGVIHEMRTHFKEIRDAFDEYGITSPDVIELYEKIESHLAGLERDNAAMMSR